MGVSLLLDMAVLKSIAGRIRNGATIHEGKIL